MILLKYLLITHLFFSYSMKAPNPNHNLYNYEYAGGMRGALAKNINLKYFLYFLFERENDLYGNGNDVNIEYIISKKFPLFKLHDVIFKRKLTSYYRQVKDINIVTYDHVYKIYKNLFLGLSLGYFDFKEYDLMGEISFENESLKINYKQGFNKYIFKIMYFKNISIYKSFYIQPLISYLNSDYKIDYQIKLLAGLKLK